MITHGRVCSIKTDKNLKYTYQRFGKLENNKESVIPDP